MPTTYYHSVHLLEDKCKGCTNCIKGCPTETIRVREGKALIISDLCIDCGECIRRCPNNAKIAISDSFGKLEKYKYKIVLPAPSFYAQFERRYKREKILQSLLDIGFDDVFEVALAAEATAIAINKIMNDTNNRPLISQACPAVVGIIQVRFPSLIGNIIPVPSPMNVAAYLAKKSASERTGFSFEEIGCFFISPCPAKISSIKHPVLEGENFVDGSFSMDEIYGRCLKAIKSELQNQDLPLLARASKVGISWAKSGGEMASIEGKTLAVDGIHNVIKALEAVENEELNHVDFIECQACVEGCIGGCLTPINPYVAKANVEYHLSQANNTPIFSSRKDINHLLQDGVFEIKFGAHPRKIKPLDKDLSGAIEKMEQLENILEDLPGLDCSSCGSPGCRALAEDIVRGSAKVTDCVFKLRERLAELSEEMVQLSKIVPPAMGKK